MLRKVITPHHVWMLCSVVAVIWLEAIFSLVWAWGEERGETACLLMSEDRREIMASSFYLPSGQLKHSETVLPLHLTPNPPSLPFSPLPLSLPSAVARAQSSSSTHPAMLCFPFIFSSYLSNYAFLLLLLLLIRLPSSLIWAQVSGSQWVPPPSLSPSAPCEWNRELNKGSLTSCCSLEAQVLGIHPLFSQLLRWRITW